MPIQRLINNLRDYTCPCCHQAFNCTIGKKGDPLYGLAEVVDLLATQSDRFRVQFSLPDKN